VAGTPWTAEHPLALWIREAPHALGFFQALHLIERYVPSAAPLGHQDARREAVRLRPELSLAFPAADISGADWLDSGPGRLQLTTTFLGLYGSASPLPSHFTEALLGESEADRRVRDFLDLFHHRLLALLYRVWKKYRYHVTFAAGGGDPISLVVRALLGLGTADTAEHLNLPTVRMFRYAGLLAQRPRSAVGLAGVVRDFFAGIPAEVQPCVGRWLPIEPSEQNRLGERNVGLGQDFLLGERVYDASGKFRVRLGPVGFEDYCRFLPEQGAATELRELARFYCGDPLEFDVEVTLDGAQVPDTPLGGQGLLGRLAWTSWLKSQPVPDQPVVFGAPANAPAGTG
jgi:type VI secretion system protein ImpH